MIQSLFKRSLYSCLSLYLCFAFASACLCASDCGARPTCVEQNVFLKRKPRCSSVMVPIYNIPSTRVEFLKLRSNSSSSSLSPLVCWCNSTSIALFNGAIHVDNILRNSSGNFSISDLDIGRIGSGLDTV